MQRDGIAMKKLAIIASVVAIAACSSLGRQAFQNPIVNLRDVRVLGAIGVVQLDHEVDLTAATRGAVAQGVWLRPFRDLVYAMPPYACTDNDVMKITNGMIAAVAAG